MSNRDEFTQKAKDAVAARAGWHCSMCNKHTVGPSEERSDAIAKSGKAAHIAAAAPGGRRYDPAMTVAQRSGIGNAIWMCSDHAELIDRDEVTYTVGRLQTMKRDHEQAIGRAVRTGAFAEIATGLLGIGPDVIITGDLTGISADGWTLRLAHFLTGDMHKLVSYIDAFGSSPSESRYILSNELGDGRRKTDDATARVAGREIVAKPADPRQSGFFDAPIPGWMPPCLKNGRSALTAARFRRTLMSRNDQRQNVRAVLCGHVNAQLSTVPYHMRVITHRFREIHGCLGSRLV